MKSKNVAALVLGISLASSPLAFANDKNSKCGTGKCGSEKNSVKEQSKCGTGKCGSSKVEDKNSTTPTMKCGTGKCGSSK